MPNIHTDSQGRKRRRTSVSWDSKKGKNKLAEERREAKRQRLEELSQPMKRSLPIRSRANFVRVESNKKMTYKQRHAALTEAHRLYHKKIPVQNIISRTGVTKATLYR